MVGLISHEYAHDWEIREGNMSPNLFDPSYIHIDFFNLDRKETIFAEGFAEWVAFKTLDFYGLDYVMETYGYSRFARHGYSVYSEGFEVLKWIEDHDGLEAVLQFIKTGEGYDIEELYEKSGVKERVYQMKVKLEEEHKETKGEADESEIKSL